MTNDELPRAESLADRFFAAMTEEHGVEDRGMVSFNKDDLYTAFAIVIARVESETMDLHTPQVRKLVARAAGTTITQMVARLLTEYVLPSPLGRPH